MIALASDCLLFQLTNGESIPFSAGMISVELMGDAARLIDPELVQHAAKAVFHYFKHELCRHTVTVEEFGGLLEKVLRGFKPRPTLACDPVSTDIVESDLGRLALESGDGCELVFFPKLRQELRQQLQQGARVLRFRGLRSCVKHLVGAQRWGLRCRGLEEQIVDYLRECLGVEVKPAEFALLVE